MAELEGERRKWTNWTAKRADPEAERCDAGYAQVIENPVSRWSQRMCVAAGVRCDQPHSIGVGVEVCCSKQHQPIAQERAWTSPIWYRP